MKASCGPGSGLGGAGDAIPVKVCSSVMDESAADEDFVERDGPGCERVLFGGMRIQTIHHFRLVL